MKKLLILLALLPILTTAQTTSKKEFVSQRIADAISNGKFYMKLSGIISIDDDEDGNITMKPVLEIAVKNGVGMTRMPEMKTVTLVANGYNYQLDEASKTYMPVPPRPNEPDLNFDLGKLSFQSQGKCQLNGMDFYYDLWRTTKGRNITFYYNSAKVSAIDLGMKEQGLGVMNLLAFDTRIPDNMYFCLTPEWEKNGMASGSMSGIDTDALMEQALSEIDTSELPEGIDLKSLMKGGGIDLRKIIEQEMGNEELPEGMSMDDIMSMVSPSQNSSAAIKQLEQMKQLQEENIPQMRKMLREQGVPKAQIEYMMENLLPDTEKMGQGIEVMKQQEAYTKMQQNAPEPPKCSCPWTDSSQSCELAAGTDMGGITVNGEHAHSPYIYKDDLDEPTLAAINMSKEVTDEGVWRAFNALAKETEGMTQEAAMAHIMEQCSMLPNAAEMGFVTGEVIERAIAICMHAPTALSYNNAGLLFFQNGDTKNALAYYQQAEKMDGENPTVLANIAECFLELGDRTSARRYADRAVSLAPDFGLAYQILTTLNLAEGKYVSAAETLFRGAETHFSEITAQQFFSLQMAIEMGGLKVCQGLDFHKLFHSIFSEKNLALLTKATQAGYDKHSGIDTPGNQKRLPWLIPGGNLQLTYMAMTKRRKELEAENEKLYQRNVEIENSDIKIGVIQAMGMRNYKDELKNAENLAKSMTSYKFDMPNIPDMDLYAMASMSARGSNDGCYLLDARQYWCLQMWKTYYECQYDYLQGKWYCEDKGFGKRPDAILEREKAMKVVEELEPVKRGLEMMTPRLEACEDAYDDCCENATTELQSLRCKEAYLRCKIPIYASYVRDYFSVAMGDYVNVNKPFYETQEQPLLEEYWLRMTDMVSYCEDLAMQEYFLNEVAQFINTRWTQYMYPAENFGVRIQQEWNATVTPLEKELGQVIEEINYLDQPVIPAVKKSGGELKDYGPKERSKMGFAIPTPWGKVGYRHNGEQYGFFSENEATGKTKFWGNDGRNTIMETYDCITDKPHANDPKGYGATLGKWAAEKGTKDMIGKAAKGLGLGAATAFIPVAKSSDTRQRSRTVDSQGNVSSSGISHTSSRTIGVDALNMTRTKVTTRSGNSVRTVNHASYNFMGLIEITETF